LEEAEKKRQVILKEVQEKVKQNKFLSKIKKREVLDQKLYGLIYASKLSELKQQMDTITKTSD